MNNDFNSRLAKGKRTEANVAHYAPQFGWTVFGIGGIGFEEIPTLISKNDEGDLEHTKAPDLIMEKWPLQAIALEAKSMKTYDGSFIVDVRRLDYIRKWEQLKRQLVIWVIERSDNDNELICASTEKLLTSYHTYDPTSTKYKSTKLEPTYLYWPEVFIPFRKVVETQLSHIQITQSMYLPSSKEDGELIQV